MKSIFVLLSMILASTGSKNFLPEKFSPKQNPKGFAVVELFTSEGCSSCPPADEAVAEIAKDNSDHVFVVGFHVDYWNNLGWKDQYSEHAYTERQKQYATIFNLNSIYTPQVVVNGKKEFVGSNTNQLKKTVADEISSVKNVSFAIDAESSDNKTINVNYRSEKTAGKILNIVLVQLSAVSNVKAGENSGRALKHINVARAFKSFDLGKSSSENVKFEFPNGLGKKDCVVVAYVQDKNNFQISAVNKTIIK